MMKPRMMSLGRLSGLPGGALDWTTSTSPFGSLPVQDHAIDGHIHLRDGGQVEPFAKQ